ncbi:MAG: tRNA (guanine(46)-N(7))-methyltransferase TrmB [Pseudomonadota bacterium]
MPSDQMPANKGYRTVYGRRQGRPLRVGLQRLIQDKLPALAVPIPNAGRQIDLASLFPNACDQIWLEIGFGGGEHLAWQARMVRDSGWPVGIIGAEYFINGVARLLRHLEGARCEDLVRIHSGDVWELLSALPPDSLSRVFVLFPDPWPKARHHKRRLLQPAFLDVLEHLMKDRGLLRVATDDPDYLTWIMGHFQDNPAFEWEAQDAKDWRCRPTDWPPTRYEEKALAAGRRGYFLSYRHHRRAG